MNSLADLVSADVTACEALANFSAADLVDSLSAATGVSALSFAALPSVALVHNHLPTKNVVQGCEYCRLYGNVFQEVDGPEPSP
jgi:hypothetical protein